MKSKQPQIANPPLLGTLLKSEANFKKMKLAFISVNK